MQISSIALGGLDAAQQKVESTARRMAQPETTGDTLDLSADMVALMDAKNQFAANTKVIQTAGEMRQHLLDMLG